MTEQAACQTARLMALLMVPHIVRLMVVQTVAIMVADVTTRMVLFVVLIMTLIMEQDVVSRMTLRMVLKAIRNVVSSVACKVVSLMDWRVMEEMTPIRQLSGLEWGPSS
jgi:hypothetical protein